METVGFSLTSTPKTIDKSKCGWFEFHQNNSGGVFNKEDGHKILIHAPTAERANQIAQEYGVYFGGRGDYPCCGDRWSKVYGDPDFEGTLPELINKLTKGYNPNKKTSWRKMCALDYAESYGMGIRIIDADENTHWLRGTRKKS